jgi:hypothetical protein
LLPPVSTAGIENDDDVNRLVKQVHEVVAQELSVSEGRHQQSKAS